MKKRVYRFRVRFRREKEGSGLPCFSLGLGDDRQRTSGSGNVSLAVFITSVSGRESLTFLTNCYFHLSRSPGFRKGMKDLAAFSVRNVKRAAAEEREKDEYSFAERQ